MAYKKDITTLRNFLPCGTKISVKVEFGRKDNYCFNSQVIGFKTNSYLIIDYPQKAIEDLIIRNLKNAKVIIRAKSNSELGHIIAFRTNVLSMSMQPVPLLFLKLPLDYESKPIRKYPRFQFSGPVEVYANERSFKGSLDDFSVSGCKVHVESNATFKKDSKIHVKISIYPDEDSIVPGTITNITSYKSGQVLGVLFDRLLPFDDKLQSAIFKHFYPDCC